MNRRHLAVLAALALAACSEKKPAPPPSPPPTPPVTPVAAKAEVKPEPAPEWVYTSVGKRDPFRSFLVELDSSATQALTRCATPLGRYELEQLKLVAVVTGLDDPIAMVEAPTGIGYSLKRGACVGRNGGVVAAVRSGEVVVAEWAVRADGTRDRTQSVLRLPQEPSLNLEE